MSDQTAPPSAEAPVLTSVEGEVGRIRLNRPRALNALNRDMCSAMIEALMAWRNDDRVKAIMLDHVGERGFCAGGDIRMVAASGAGDGAEAGAFFHTEYRLNHLLTVYPKPVVAFLDGIVMGGGVGISAPAKVRIATERTSFAMPETGIGLFPDVGGGWRLPRMPGRTGIWLALTGARLDGAECVALGLATHYVESGKLEPLKAAILEDAAAVFGAPELFIGDPGAAKVQANRDLIDQLFVPETLEAIFAGLEAHESAWAAKELATLRRKSPLSMKVSLRQMLTGARMPSFADNMRMEYRLAVRVVRTHDFQEGVRAVIVDKDNAPHWRPETLAGVDEPMLDSLFAPLPPEQEWTPLPGL